VFVEQDDEILARDNEKQSTSTSMAGGREFDIPLLLVGTGFQKRVWEALMRVPYGVHLNIQANSGGYRQSKGRPRRGQCLQGQRLSAQLCPCHRIIGSDGELVGYGGGLSVKKRLLELERRNTALRDY
jgi:methylated-DNA-[protein]-cysteine S-methyltransferase